MNGKIRVVVADDSPFVRRLLTGFLEASPDFEVVGTASNGRDALRRVSELRPDVVTLDLEMPEMDGLEALAHMMRECPTPVVTISGVSGRSATRTMQAIDMGAVDFVLKYAPGVRTDPDELRREIVSRVRLASRIRVVRSLGGVARPDAGPGPAGPKGLAVMAPWTGGGALETAPLIVIGASTGGPPALQELLSGLSRDFAGRIIVVQHMPRGFTSALAAQFARNCGLRVKEVNDRETLELSTVAVAPGGYDLLVLPRYEVTIRPRESAVPGYCPSIDAAMESAARGYGSRTIGVLLTGMGDDGAAGMGAIRSRGGSTFAQDADSCVVNGMPERAREHGAVSRSARPDRIAQLLIEEMERRCAYAR